MPEHEDKSLILGSGEQLPLMEVDDVGLPASAYADAEERGRFTGERLFLQNPKLYNAVVSLIGRALPYREIAEICQVSVNTVCAVVLRERIPIETIRESIGRLGLDVSKLTLEAIRDLLADPMNAGKFSIKDLAVVHGIATTNAQLVLGAATSRVEHSDITAPGHDDYEALMREVRERAIKNVTPTGLDGGNPANKEGAPAALENGAPTVDLPAPTGERTPSEPSASE